MKRSFLLIAIVFSFMIGAFGQQPVPKTAIEIRSEGKSLLDQGKIDEAIKKFEESIKADPKDVNTLMALGSAYLQEKNYSKAEEAYRKAVTLSPENGMVNAALCASLGYQKKFDEALKACDDAYRLDPKSDSINAVRLETMFLSGKDAREVLRQLDLAVGNFHQSIIMLRSAANIYIAVRNYTYAATLLERLIGFEPNVAEYHGRLAEVYLRLARDTESLAEARKAIELDSSNPYGNYAMACIFYELGQYRDASDLFSRIPPNTRWLGDARRFLALSLGNLGHASEAADILIEIVQQNPKDIQLQYELAEQLLNSKRNREAVEIYTRIDQLAPNNLAVISGLGMANMNLANFDEAIYYFDKGLSLRPGMPELVELSRVSRARRNSASEIVEITESVNSNPKDVILLMKLGRRLAHLNRIEEADKYFQRIYELDAPQPEAYVLIGIAYSEAGQKNKAIDAYRRSLAKEENADAYLNLATVLSDQGKFDEATAAYEKFLKFRPNDAPGIMSIYAAHLEKAGKRREALTMYRRTLAIAPTDAISLFHAGILSLKLGEPDAAKTYLEALKTFDGDLARKLEACIRLRIW